MAKLNSKGINIASNERESLMLHRKSSIQEMVLLLFPYNRCFYCSSNSYIHL
jgi:hypothetical protein